MQDEDSNQFAHRITAGVLFTGTALVWGLIGGIHDALINIVIPSEIQDTGLLILNSATTAVLITIASSLFFAAVIGPAVKKSVTNATRLIAAYSAAGLLFLGLGLVTGSFTFSVLTSKIIQRLIIFAALSAAGGLSLANFGKTRTLCTSMEFIKIITVLTMVLLSVLAAVVIFTCSSCSAIVRIAVVLGCAGVIITMWYRFDRLPGRFGMILPVTLLYLITAAVAAGVGVTYSLSFRPGNRPPEYSGRLDQVLLITIDALRTDCLSCYNPETPVTGGIDSVARESAVFNNVIASAPWTLPSFCSIMTGQPVNIHDTYHGDTALPDTLITIAERMQEAGYTTAAIVHNPYLGREHHVNQGFRYYRHFPKKSEFGCSPGAHVLRLLFPATFFSSTTSARLADTAIDFIKNHRDRPFFLWLHFLDPHIPYAPPDRYIDRTKTAPGIGNEFSRLNDIRMGTFLPDSLEQAAIRHLYEAEIQYVDDQVQRIISACRAAGIYDNALVILASDHGEEFWDHGGFEHGHALYNEVIRVPLIIKPPAPADSPGRGVRIDHYVSQTRLFNTILDLCGLLPDSANQAPSLRPLMESPASSPNQEPIYCSGMLYGIEQESLIRNGSKFIQAIIEDSTSLFDLRTDPLELHNTAAGSPAAVRRMTEYLDSYHDRSAAKRAALGMTAQRKIKLSKKIRAQLRSLGYIK